MAEDTNTTSVKLPFILSGEYFVVESHNGNNVQARCKFCPNNKIIKGSFSTTTNFHKHLKGTHADKYKNYEENKRNNGAKRARLDVPVNQPAISNFVEKTETKSMSAFDRKIVNFIVNGMHPISIVEEPSFRALFPNETLHHRHYYRQRIQLLATEQKTKLIQKLKSIQHLCLTADMWTCRGMTRSFMGVTVHWIECPPNASVTRHSRALICRRFKGSHDNERIAEFLVNIMSEYGITLTQVTRVITDNGSNFGKAFRRFGVEFGYVEEEDEDADFDRVDSLLECSQSDEPGYKLPAHGSCADHSLNCICTYDLPKMKQQKIMHSAFGKCYGVWNKISRSTQASESVKEITTNYLRTPVKTRWNSLYNSLKDLLKHRINLEKICTAAEIPAFTQPEIEFMESYSFCVRPIATALKHLEGEKNTFYGELMPTLFSARTSLRELCNSRPEHSHNIPDVLLAGLEKRFKNFFEFSPECNDAIIAAVSHPRWKLDWVPAEKLGEIKEAFISTAIQERSSSEEISIVPDEECYSDKDDDDDNDKPFFNFPKAPLGSIEVETAENSARMECLKFLLNESKGLNVLNQFPLIKRVFIKYNTALPSSAPVERLFSYSNMILNPKRMRLTDDMFEILTLLKINPN